MIFNKFKNGAGDYSIPMVRLDVMPENTPDELKYIKLIILYLNKMNNSSER